MDVRSSKSCISIRRNPTHKKHYFHRQIQSPRLIEPIVIVHGGAGDSPDSRDTGKHQGTKLAARLGYDKLLAGGSVLDAVEEAVRSMELDENFNAGFNLTILILGGAYQGVLLNYYLEFY